MDEQFQREQAIRLANINRIIIEEHADDARAFAERIGLRPQSIYSTLQRKITENRARHIEQVYGKDRGWLDQDHGGTPNVANFSPPPTPMPERRKADQASIEFKRAAIQVLEQAVERMTTRQVLELIHDAVGKTQHYADDIEEMMRLRKRV